MRRTKEDAAETKRQILQAAETLFLERGFENVTLDEIATAVGTSRGAVHWHFCNKQGLLFALRGESQLPLRELADALETEVEGQPLEMLGDVLSKILFDMHSDERRRGLMRLMLHLDISVDCPVPKEDRDSYKAMERIFAKANKINPLNPPWTPKKAASAVTAVVLGVLEEWALERSEFPLVPYGQDLVKIAIKGFQN
ncbi:MULTISPECIES: TetR family transcriptional regulator [unclassified Rhizobium]|uniref:TetR family transcriptional regulator n=1 Tax=unclassified Rhizobium TaxID=2613769 RepID=UPI000BDA5C98|nr:MULTISPECIES: TetR family transcriptional regulator [unclassified Rhizobium]MDH7809518.1 AcrR family transcriptional regulator [Rhizobium sp. AN67]MDQ4408763.1 TetR family transcriptional regulator [Rhizobium sp. AN63]SOD50443.1 transcriptional regulator, TetR family [Rhizobium sp. AN6A]